MGYLAGFTWAQRAAVVAAALDGARVSGPLLVLGPQPLARALAQRRGTTVWVTGSATGRLRQPTVRARRDALPFADGALGGLVSAARDEPPSYDEWLRAVRDGGAVVLVAPLAAEELTRRVMCAGLTDVEQRRAGRLLVTSGRVWRPSAPA